MGKIKRIVVHCTGEPANAQRNREYYSKWFFDFLGWKHYGYHVVVYQDGEYSVLQPFPSVRPDGGYIDGNTMANGAKGYNSDSLHIAYVGGLSLYGSKPDDTRTLCQRETLRNLIKKWKKEYHISEVVGHNQLPGVTKACPCFDARKEYENV